MKPGYQNLYSSGILKQRTEILNSMLESCTLCPHECKVNRNENSTGKCRSGKNAIIASYCVHHGEEPALGGSKGVGNIFFANCNLKCCFCQNYEISQKNGKEFTITTAESLADIMLELQNSEVSSIGLVSAVHFLPQIFSALLIAIPRGLNLPIIYNTNGYEKVETLKLLDGIIDIFLPDFKYGENEFAEKYSKANNYFETASKAITEMVRQVGTKLTYNSSGIVQKGIIIRHLVLPNDLADSQKVLKCLFEIAGNSITLSVMAQYFPTFKASGDELLNRPIRESEYERVLNFMDKYNFENGWIQEFNSKDIYRPNFANKESPFINLIY